MTSDDCLNLRLSDWLRSRRETAPDARDDDEKVDPSPPSADEDERN
jgi:hypothetical protein